MPKKAKDEAVILNHRSELLNPTPMMQQYLDVKNSYDEYVLLYRLGDFYEMFFEDAVRVSRAIELTLTGRDCGHDKENSYRAAMCGVPFHKLDHYIALLLANGFKVAVCEQTENPAEADGLVRREVVRVVTPGTVTDGDMLDGEKNNYLAALCYEENQIAVAFADISTGLLSVTHFDGGDRIAAALNELSLYQPTEVLLNLPEHSCPEIAAFLNKSDHAIITDDRGALFSLAEAERVLPTAFGEEEHKKMTVSGEKRSVIALLGYIRETQKSDVSFIRGITVYGRGQYMEMDASTRRNLELVVTMRDREKKGSLLHVIDKTQTAMGGRMLRSWLLHPLLNPIAIEKRQAAVSDLFSDYMVREELRVLLSSILDIERLTAKAVYGTANAKDLAAIRRSIAALPDMKELLLPFSSHRLCRIRESLDALSDVSELLNKAIIEEPPFSLREGGIIREGYSEEVDYLRSVETDGKGWIERIEEEEREASGIKGLHIGFNKVFGYYIEVTKSQVPQVPDRYIRKQTLTNCERYITQELKDMEATILGATDKLCALEYALFQEIREKVAAAASRLQSTAAAIAEIDCYRSLADVASKNRYTCPEVNLSDKISVKDGRHPVVEKFVSASYFVPNDTNLSNSGERVMLITGPNMAGKSTYMRQVALLTVLAQIGSFLPAASAEIGIVDRIFTRVGASDDLASGQSTFMLEMNEVAYILKNATSRSLIIYDEVGRGTSTYDGMSIARAVLEYTAGKKISAKTLFATHYHELTVMEDEISGIVNYNIAAKKHGDDITFLRKIVRGATDDSYGIEVAKLAGLPNEVIRRAREILTAIESEERMVRPIQKAPQKANDADLFSLLQNQEESAVAEKLRKTDINTLTPIEAMNLIFELKNML